jgi:RHH-type proline utilization regulon transcriptional repressor/proline dehydrogenase/delta 1-pyrroline-5-carboxylate dehydrogenase
MRLIPYASNKLDAVINAVNDSGYGLTLGVHTRVDSTRRHIQQRVRVPLSVFSPLAGKGFP